METAAKQLDLFGRGAPRKTRREKFLDYEGFVEKFKHKKTTDDCYTPKYIYDELLKYINDKVYPLDGLNIVRPFYPGGNYEAYPYKEDDVVIDNPPFSILSKILDFYNLHGIKYWLFAPYLTLFSYVRRDGTLVITNSEIVYENGANVKTSFITNLYPREKWVVVNGELHDILEQAQKEVEVRKEKAVYKYPKNLVTSVILGNYIASKGRNFEIYRNEGVAVRYLDNSPKPIFGNGILLSDSAAERAAAERAAAEIKIELSEREKRIISDLDKFH